MSSSYATCTKEKTISYEQRLFIKRTLRQLGLNSKTDGFSYIQKAIILAYEYDMISINFRELCKYIGNKHSLSFRTIEAVSRYSIYNLNSKKLSDNYEDIFGIEFSLSNFNICTLISDFLDILEDFEFLD
jgi:hypothetical protein